MKLPVAVKVLSETTGPKANAKFMDVSLDGCKVYQFFRCSSHLQAAEGAKNYKMLIEYIGLI